MKSKAMWILVLVCAVTAAPFLARPAHSAPVKLHIGFNTWVGYGPLFVAQEKGFFADQGLQVELERIEETSARRMALSSKRLDILGSTLDDLVVGASQGVEATMICACDESDGADGIVVKNDIATIKDLKGKSIAVQPGFVNHFFLLYLLDKNGMSESDVKVVAMEPDKAGAAFVAGQIDAAVTWEPWLSKAKERKDGKVLATSKDAPGVIVDILIARNDLVKDAPDSLMKLVRAWNNAVAFMALNADEANDIIAKNLGITKEDAAGMLSGVKLFAKDENLAYVGGGKAAEIGGKAVELLAKAKVIEKQPDIKTLINDHFVQPKKKDHPDHPGMGGKKDDKK